MKRIVSLTLALALLGCSSGSRPNAAGSAGVGGGGAGSSASAAGSEEAAGGTSSAPNGSAGASGATADSSGNGGSGGRGVAGASASVTVFPVCAPPIGSCPAHSIGIWQPLLAAADFGTSAHFIAARGLAVLVAIGDGNFRVARLHDPVEATPGPAYQSWDFPNGSTGSEPLAIAEGRLSDIVPVPPNMVLVLTCDDARAHCSLWRSDISGDQLSNWQEMPMPADFTAQGVTLDREMEPRQICVYGGGMYCWADRWQEAIPAASALRLNDVAYGSQWSLAVGDHGRWFKRAHDDAGTLGAWQEQPPLGDVALSQVSVAADGGTIVGAGKLQAVVGSQAQLYDCAVTNDVVAFILDPVTRGLGYVVTDTGKILQHALTSAQRADAYCDYQQLTLPGAVIDTDVAPCADSINPHLLTASALLGQSQCIMTF